MEIDVSGLPADDSMMQLELKRRLARAEALRNQDMPQGQMVSGRFVAPSWTQYLANVLGKIQGGQEERNAIKQYGEYTKTKAQKQADALRQLTGDLEGTKQVNQGSYQIQVPSGNAPQTENLGGMQPIETGMKNINVPMATTTTKAPTSAERYAAIMKYGSAINDPRMIQEAIMGGISQANKAEEVASERTWREQQTKNEQEFNRILQKDRQGFELSQQEKNFANQWKLQQSSQGFQAGQNAKNRANQNANAPLVTILDTVTGKPKLVPRSQAINAMPYTPAQEAKDIQKTKGAENFDTLIGGLRDAYTQLGKMGGITSTQQGPLSNLGAGIASSGIGQATGRMFGTEAQSIRNRIAQSRPLLLNAIKEATGMSAKQMDSNAELRMYLAAATDPTLDLQTNLNALDQLYTLYGTKQSKAPGGNVNNNVVDFGSLK
jgi:hypothetical protein